MTWRVVQTALQNLFDRVHAIGMDGGITPMAASIFGDLIEIGVEINCQVVTMA
jgi:hypothetical protein